MDQDVPIEGMEIESDDEEALAAFVVLGSIYLLQKKNDRKNQLKRKRAQRKLWVRDWAEKRNVEGAYAKLLPELRSGDDGEKKLYRDFLRMSDECFNQLLDMVAPLITKQNTKFRQAISAGERLALTLNYLATGNSFKSLQYVFRIPQPTISTIIPEVLDAIWTVLKNDHIRVIPLNILECIA